MDPFRPVLLGAVPFVMQYASDRRRLVWNAEDPWAISCVNYSDTKMYLYTFRFHSKDRKNKDMYLAAVSLE